MYNLDGIDLYEYNSDVVFRRNGDFFILDHDDEWSFKIYRYMSNDMFTVEQMVDEV